jgi:hypothetical protein
VGLIAPVQADEGGELSGSVVVHGVGLWWSGSQAAGRIVRGMRCRHLSMHGCNFESDRRRIVGSNSSWARGTLGSCGDRTQGNSNRLGGEVVHRLKPEVEMKDPASAREQLRRTYTDRWTR